MKFSEINSDAAKIITLETAITEGYRALQSKLKDFQERKIVYLQVKLNSSFAVLKAEAERIIESLRQIAKAQVEENVNESVQCRIESSETEETPTAEVKAESDNFIQPCKTNRQDIYRKGDRIYYFDYYHYQSVDKMKLATVTRDQCGPDLLILVDGEENFGDRWGLESGRLVKVSDVFDICTDMIPCLEIENITEAEIYKAEFEEVVASLPVYTVVTNRDFESRDILGTPDQKAWLCKKAKHPLDIVILKITNLSAIAYAGDALTLVAILGTRSLVENGALKTHIPMLDLEGVLHKAKKQGFNIKVSDADQTVVLSRAT